MKGSSRSVANTAAQQALIAHWQGIVKSLGNFLNTLKVNHVSEIYVAFYLISFIFAFPTTHSVKNGVIVFVLLVHNFTHLTPNQLQTPKMTTLKCARP